MVNNTLAERKIREIREVRHALALLVVLSVLWWIVEFVTYAGRTEFDVLDLGFIALLVIGAWLASRAWQARCPRCANPFFVNSGLPLGVNLSLGCPYCGSDLTEISEKEGEGP